MDEKNRSYYDRLFKSYPDVVDLPTLRKMLGGISETFIRDKLRTGAIKSFLINQRFGRVYMIPKIYVIDYVLSNDYQACKNTLKTQI